MHSSKVVIFNLVMAKEDTLLSVSFIPFYIHSTVKVMKVEMCTFT